MSKVLGTFFGGEATLWQSSVFKVYVTSDGLHFGRVADRMYQEAMETGQLNNLNGLQGGLGGAAVKHGMIMPAIKKRQELEARLDALEPGSADFLNAEKRNFSLRETQVSSAKLSKMSGITKGPGRIGFLELQLQDGKKRRFTLTGADPQNAETLIRAAMPNVQGSLL